MGTTPCWSKCVLASDLGNLCTLLAPCTWSLPGSIIGNYHTKDSPGNKRLPSILHSLKSMSKVAYNKAMSLPELAENACWLGMVPFVPSLDPVFAGMTTPSTSAATSNKKTSSLEYVGWILYTVHPVSILTVPGSIVRNYHSKDSPVNPHLPSCFRSLCTLLHHLIQIVWK